MPTSYSVASTRRRSGAAGSSWTWTAARSALSKVGEQLGLHAESTAMAAIEIIDAHMSDAVRRVLSMAGADPRELDLVAFGGMGAVHAARQAAILGMHRVLVPRSAPTFSALGLLTADHVVDDTRSLISDWREIDVRAIGPSWLRTSSTPPLRSSVLRDCPQVDFASIGVSTSSIPVRRSTSRFPWADPTVARSPKQPSRPRSRSCIAATKKPG